MSREQDLAVHLVRLQSDFERDSTDAWPAFEAVARIAAYAWEIGESPAPTSLRIPWWAVEALAMGFTDYFVAAGSGEGKTLGEAYGLEGGRKGKLPHIKRLLLHRRDLRISSTIAFAMADGDKIEAALQRVADASGLSVGQVRRVWEVNRKRAMEAVSNFRTRKTS